MILNIFFCLFTLKNFYKLTNIFSSSTIRNIYIYNISLTYFIFSSFFALCSIKDNTSICFILL